VLRFAAERARARAHRRFGGRAAASAGPVPATD
jgi:hypothetical protein